MGPARPPEGAHPRLAGPAAGRGVHHDALLSCEGLTLQLGGRRVVDGLSMTLRGGEWAAIVGPNGAGKSTLLQLLAGLRRPDAGSVRLLGRALLD